MNLVPARQAWLAVIDLNCLQGESAEHPSIANPQACGWPVVQAHDLSELIKRRGRVLHIKVFDPEYDLGIAPLEIVRRSGSRVVAVRRCPHCLYSPNLDSRSGFASLSLLDSLHERICARALSKLA